MSIEKVKRDLYNWERQNRKYETSDFEMLYDLWVNQAFGRINDQTRERFFKKVDDWMLYTYTFLQGMAAQSEARERILQSGRIFNENIEKVQDMKTLTIYELTYLAEQQCTRGRVYSFAQGGLAGTGGYVFLGLDFPLMIGLNLRTIQLIGYTFGYEMNHPYEMILALKVFHGATLPKRLRLSAWNNLKKEVTTSTPYLYDGEDQLTSESWFEQPLRQVFKSVFILMFRKKLLQGLPIISIGIGAFANYSLSRQVTDFAIRFYQYRYLLEKGEIEK
ncbi:MAG: EcsC family protein [Bacillaceae bacterium]|nr:EcsC family protein [Bacillaceae bacterium]